MKSCPKNEYVVESKLKNFQMKIDHYNLENCKLHESDQIRTSHVLHIKFNFISPDGTEVHNIYDSCFTHSKKWRQQLPIHQLLLCSSLVLGTPEIKKLPINSIARKRIYAHYRPKRLEAIMRQFLDNIKLNVYNPSVRGYWWRSGHEYNKVEPRKLSPVGHNVSDSNVYEKNKNNPVVKNRNFIVFDWKTGQMRTFETGNSSVIQACTHLNEALQCIYNAKWNNEELFDSVNDLADKMVSLPLKPSVKAYFEDFKYPSSLDNATQLVVEFYSQDKCSVLFEKIIKSTDILAPKDAAYFAASWASEDGFLISSSDPFIINDTATHTSFQYVITFDLIQDQFQFKLEVYAKKIFQANPKLLSSLVLQKFDTSINFLQLKLYYKQSIWFLIMLLSSQL